MGATKGSLKRLAAMYKPVEFGAGGRVATVHLWSFFAVIATWVLAPAVQAQNTASTSAASSPTGRVVDRVVALVEGRMITLSELDFEARVALIQKGGVEAAHRPLDDEALKGALDLVIGEWLETLAADKLQAFPAEQEQSEVELALTAFRARFQTAQEFDRFLEQHQADPQQLKAILERRLRAEKILDSKVRLRARVTESDLRRYYDQHRTELGERFEAVRSRLREKLTRERYAAAAREELAQIRKGADVRLVAPFARGALGAVR
jgi:hypothetical protein